MSRRFRDKRPLDGRPLEEAFSDYEAMEPTEGERQTRKPAKATIRSAGTKAQRDAATRIRKTAAPATERARKAIARARGKRSMGFELTSLAFRSGEAIPEEHSCDGADASAPLVWKDPPVQTKSFALIVEDPDA